MTRDEKLKRISELGKIKKAYADALELMQGKVTSDYDPLKHVGLVPKLMYLLRLKKHKEIEHDYSHNQGDEELKAVIEDYMTRKIAECDAEIDAFFCDDGDKPNGDWVWGFLYK